MIRTGFLAWTFIFLLGCGNYFYDEINRTGVGVPVGDPVSYSSEFAGVYDSGDMDEAVSIVQDGAGGYVAAGNTRSFGAGGYDIIVMRLDEYGNILWQKTLGGADNDTARSMIRSGSGYVILGETLSFGSGDADLWLIKLNESGVIEWEKTFGGASTERAGGITIGDNDSIIVGASTASFSKGNFDMWFLKISSLGVLEYEVREGDIDNDIVEGVLKNADGNYLFYGYSDHLVMGSYKGMLYETDPAFNLNIGAAVEATDDQMIRAVWQAPDKGYIAVVETTAFSPSPYPTSIMAVKFDAAMRNITWQKYITGSGNSYGRIAITGDAGSFIIGGSTRASGAGEYDCFFTRMDLNGTIVTQKTIGSAGVDYCNSLSGNGSGGYTLAGYTLSFGVPSRAMFIASFDETTGIEGSLVRVADANMTVFDSTAQYESFEFPYYEIDYYVNAVDTNATIGAGEMKQRFY